MAITMTGADLSSAAKPWSIQEKSAAVIYQEFHEQVTQIVSVTKRIMVPQFTIRSLAEHP